MVDPTQSTAVSVPVPQEPVTRPSRTIRLFVASVLLIGVVSVGWLFVNSVQEAREVGRMIKCFCSFCGITMAFQIYHDQHGELPAAWSTDSNGRPLLSWRLTTLRYIGDAELLDTANLSAPWDDPANEPLLTKRPDILGCPSHPEYQSQYTQKAVVTGQGTAFPSDHQVRFDEVPDGLSNTLCVAEIRHRVPWTKPEDVDGPSHPAIGMPNGFDSHHRAGINVGFLDGSHRTLSRNIDPEILRRMILRNDGESKKVEKYLLEN